MVIPPAALIAPSLPRHRRPCGHQNSDSCKRIPAATEMKQTIRGGTMPFTGARRRRTTIGILMTGMGDDGAEGLGAIKAAGGMTIAQSEDTCVVSGMPRAAIVKGYANKIIPLDGLVLTW